MEVASTEAVVVADAQPIPAGFGTNGEANSRWRGKWQTRKILR